MRETLTVEKVVFNIRTQALLNFTPITFTFKHKEAKGELIQQNFWSEDTHRLLGKSILTYVDKDNILWEIKIINFPKEYDRLIQTLEVASHIVPQSFNLIEAGLVNFSFFNVLTFIHGKYIIPRKMQERNSYSG